MRVSGFVKTEISTEKQSLNKEEIALLLERNKDNILNDSISSLKTDPVNIDIIKNRIGTLLDEFIVILINPKRLENGFNKILEEILFDASLGEINISIWNGILSLLKQLVWLLKVDFETRSRVSDIWYTATFRVAEKIMGNKIYERMLEEKKTAALFHICQKIIVPCLILKCLQIPWIRNCLNLK